MTTQAKEKRIEPLSITVRKIDKRWHCRLFCLNKLHSESYCLKKADIGRTCRDLLRWYDKMSFTPFSDWAIWSRHNNEKGYRQNYTLEGEIRAVHRTDRF